MNWTLEVVVVPVSDVDRAKAFYSERLGFSVDHDTKLVVPDINAARAQLAERGVEVSEVQVVGESPSPQPNSLDNVGFVFFSDPDGNGWAVQQISARG
jgi:catechol 2,3-dioxygenase-like lactoylglutathione lyase family enzyme